MYTRIGTRHSEKGRTKETPLGNITHFFVGWVDGGRGQLIITEEKNNYGLCEDYAGHGVNKKPTVPSDVSSSGKD